MRLLCESEFIPIEKRSWIPKNGGNKSFSYETKASMPFIPTSRTSLWWPSWKEKRLLCKSEFVPIEKRSLILKNRGKGSFSYETKDPMSFVQMRRMSLWCSIMKEKGDYYVNPCLSQMTNEL